MKNIWFIIAVVLAIVVKFAFEELGSTEGQFIVISSASLILIFYWKEICGVVKSLANGIPKAIRNRKQIKKVLPVVGICLFIAAVITVGFTYFLGGAGFAYGVAASVIVTPKLGMDLYNLFEQEETMSI